MVLTLLSVVVDNRSDAASDETYAVYSASIKGISKSPENGQAIELFVIAQTTGGIEDEIEDVGNQILDQMKASLSMPFQNAVSDYKEKRKKSQKLTRSFDLETKYELIDKADFNAFFKGKNLRMDWKNFYYKYPKSPGFIVFSNVGFDAERKHAIVYREIHCGSLCGDSSFVLLENINGRWKATNIIPVGAS